jgi:hypothetical protein
VFCQKSLICQKAKLFEEDNLRLSKTVGCQKSFAFLNERIEELKNFL